MFQPADLLAVIDAYKAAADVTSDTTASHRIFGDTKKVKALRDGGDLTLGRAALAMGWLHDNWPEGREMPAALASLNDEGAAA